MEQKEKFSLPTEMVQIKNPALQKREIARAAELLQRGELVAFPTETVYGIGALALDEGALKKLFMAKNRPEGKAFSVQIANVNMLQQVAAYIPQTARSLIEHFCPGPITVIVPRAAAVPALATGGRDTLGIRIPDNPIALALLQAVGAPLAVPSANVSGHTSPRTAQEVYGDMAGRLAMLLDGGPCTIGQESTIVDCTSPQPVIVRRGAISEEEVFAVL